MLSSTDAARHGRAAAPTLALQVLLCHAGAIVCGLPLQHVIETMRPLSIEPLAGMPPFVSGLAVIRGAPLPVVSLARLLGHDAGQRPTRFVIVRAAERRVALAVERVLGVSSIRGDAAEALPPLLGSAQADFVATVGALDARLLVVLESSRVIPDAIGQLLAVEGARA